MTQRQKLRIVTYHFSRYTFFDMKLNFLLVRSLHLLRRSICSACNDRPCLAMQIASVCRHASVRDAHESSRAFTHSVREATIMPDVSTLSMSLVNLNVAILRHLTKNKNTDLRKRETDSLLYK